MTIIEAIVLGAIQGLTEFIPISSSGHLVIAQTFLSGASDHLFLEWINLGTVLALIIFFRKRIGVILNNIFVQHDYRLARNIIVAALPAGLIGFLFANYIERLPVFSSVWTVVFTLAIVGILLVLLEKLPRLSSVKSNDQLSWQRSLTIGLAQVAAFVPGTSRSGSTIIAGRMTRDALAAEVRKLKGRDPSRPSRDRIQCRFENGLSFTLCRHEPIDFESLLDSINRLRKVVTEMKRNGDDPGDLAKFVSSH